MNYKLFQGTKLKVIANWILLLQYKPQNESLFYASELNLSDVLKFDLLIIYPGTR